MSVVEALDAGTAGNKVVEGLVELSDGVVSVGAGASSLADGVELEAAGGALNAGLLSVFGSVSADESTACVEVDERNGWWCSMNDPFDCTAYSPTSRSPLGVSYSFWPVVWTQVMPLCVGMGAYGSSRFPSMFGSPGNATVVEPSVK